MSPCGNFLRRVAFEKKTERICVQDIKLQLWKRCFGLKAEVRHHQRPSKRARRENAKNGERKFFEAVTTETNLRSTTGKKQKEDKAVACLSAPAYDEKRGTKTVTTVGHATGTGFVVRRCFASNISTLFAEKFWPLG